MSRRNLSLKLTGGVWFLALVIVLIPRGVDAQVLTYASGQTMQPAFEGWEQNQDGSYNLLFGYLNRNWEEEFDIPVGPDNLFSPGSADRGQPTHFLPRRNRLAFRVHVPADFSEDDRLVWTVRSKGETLTAIGMITADLFVDNIVIMSENGSIGNGATTAEIRANIPPVSELEGEAERWVRVGEPVTLAVRVSDDGVPRRRGFRRPDSSDNPRTPPGPLATPEDLARVGEPSMVVPGKVNGLHVSWFVYRGQGEVTVDPPQIKVWEDTRPYSSPWGHRWIHPTEPEDGWWVARATFREAGTYVLRGKVDDGGLQVDHDVIIHVADLVP
jgi:hypothetical protein